MASYAASNDTEKPFAEEGYALMGAVFEVHKELGGGLLEEIYQECLEIELAERGIPFVAKFPLTTFYKGRRLIKRYVPDLIVHQNIVVELKSMSGLVSEHEAQLMNYMRLTRHPVGYLINFAPIAKVEWKRIIISEFLQDRTAGVSSVASSNVFPH
ncbi:MAG: GxxExxY protein [Pirellulales bacterium]